MGTNYYLERKSKSPCQCCGRPYEAERLHIGKSSRGWVFALHVGTDPDGPLPRDLAEWRNLWLTPEWQIVDEYGHQISEENMLWIITGRPAALQRRSQEGDDVRYGGPSSYDLHTGDFS